MPFKKHQIYLFSLFTMSYFTHKGGWTITADDWSLLLGVSEDLFDLKTKELKILTSTKKLNNET